MLRLYWLPMYWKQHRNTSVQIIIIKTNKQTDKFVKKTKKISEKMQNQMNIPRIYHLAAYHW